MSWRGVSEGRDKQRTRVRCLSKAGELKASTPEEWTGQLLRLVGDAALRRRWQEVVEQVLEHIRGGRRADPSSPSFSLS